MVEYIKAVLVKAFGVFATTFLGALGADTLFENTLVGTGAAFADAATVSASAALVTVVWPAASRLAARAQATKIPDINSPPGGGGARLP